MYKGSNNDYRGIKRQTGYKTVEVKQYEQQPINQNKPNSVFSVD